MRFWRKKMYVIKSKKSLLSIAIVCDTRLLLLIWRALYITISTDVHQSLSDRVYRDMCRCGRRPFIKSVRNWFDCRRKGSLKGLKASILGFGGGGALVIVISRHATPHADHAHAKIVINICIMHRFHEKGRGIINWLYSTLGPI